jgi:hypothetical protein
MKAALNLLAIGLLILTTSCASTTNTNSDSNQQAARAAQLQEQALADGRARAAREAEATRRQALLDARVKADAAVEALRQQEEQALAVTRQQQRIAELRTQITTNQAEASNLDKANAVLSEAITTAENLSATLAAEQEKYASTNPVTGETVEALAKARIEELKAQIVKLRAQAAALTSATP